METINWSNSFLSWLAHTTIQASFLVGLVLTLQWIFRPWLSARWRFFLWILVLLRLSLPILPQSRLSIYNLWPEEIKNISLHSQNDLREPKNFPAPSVQPIQSSLPHLQVPSQSAELSGDARFPAPPPSIEVTTPLPLKNIDGWHWGLLNLPLALLLLWLIGTVLFLARSLITGY